MTRIDPAPRLRSLLRAIPSAIWRTWVPLCCGLVILVRIVADFGGHAAFVQMISVGWGMILIVGAHLLPLLSDTLTWRLLFLGRARISRLQTFVLTWVSQSFNRFTPTANLGGELLRIHLTTRRGVPSRIAASTVIADVALGAASMVPFAGLGLGLLAAGAWHPSAASVPVTPVRLAAGLVIVAMSAGALAMLFRGGVLRAAAGLVRRFAGPRRLHGVVRWLLGTDAALMALARARLRLLAALASRFMGWVAGAVEIWVALWLLGAPHDFAAAIIVESLSQVVRGAAFFMPLALGVQEAGIVAAAALVGIDPVTAIALALLRRVREVAIALPALVAWIRLARVPAEAPAGASGLDAVGS